MTVRSIQWNSNHLLWKINNFNIWDVTWAPSGVVSLSLSLSPFKITSVPSPANVIYTYVRENIDLSTPSHGYSSNTNIYDTRRTIKDYDNTDRRNIFATHNPFVSFTYKSNENPLSNWRRKVHMQTCIIYPRKNNLLISEGAQIKEGIK